MFRVDDRLIHGQVAVMWSKELAIKRIIVASDVVAANPIQVSALKMAAPEGIKAAVLPVDKAAEILNDPRSDAMNILVLSNTPDDLLRLIRQIGERSVMDVANYGRIGGGGLSDKKKISETVYLTEKDEDVLRQIADLGVELIHQPLPGDPRLELIKLMEGK